MTAAAAAAAAAAAEEDEEEQQQHAQPETSASTPNSTNAQNSSSKTAHAPKDRSCPFCGQAFTSSSLGRHLDLYIRPKNPKPADGVHDVDEIKKLRGGITRRQPRTSGRVGIRSQSNSHSRQNSHGHGADAHEEDNVASSNARAGQDTPIHSPVNAKDVHESTTFFNKAKWQATGVINNLPPRVPSRGTSEHPQPHGTASQAQRVQDMRRDAAGSRIQRPEYEGEGMWKLQEAVEMGRAAEMALREVLGSLEAAAKKVEAKLLYDDFDYFSLSFAGLCLAILPPPGSLFSPTPFPSPESWTLSPPGLRQFEVMARFLNERVNQRQKHDPVPDSVSFRHHGHLSGAWEHWEAMTEADRAAAWQLELLRSFTRSEERNRQLKSEVERLQQHNRHLEAEYDRLSRCQLPREYLSHPPNTIPVPSAVMKEMKSSGSSTTAAEADYNVENLISKWRATIRANTRLARVPQAASQQPIYAESVRSDLRDDMVMTGSVWSVGGPLPRGHTRDSHHEMSSISYETPPNPGTVVGAAEDDATPRHDADADGEADDAYARYGDTGAVAKRRRTDETVGTTASQAAQPETAGVLNMNGKRPLNGRGGPRILKETLR
ncbi:hypothetical protein Slin15195_G014810 [Septoria linicola]|uniref:Uncharacterized protein n=1 Tax=Septoria linicola TaxID=215465 RepID=A0A9Q9ALD3_9PEZI|nr:hypothetical protein Slin15195_G014810 [Septoria linicola]